VDPEIRQLVILLLLSRAHGPLPAGEVRDTLQAVRVYADDPDSAHRRFSDDLKALRRADLVRYGSLRPGSTVDLVRTSKDPALRLTLREHEAIQTARESLARSSPGVSRVPRGAGAEKLSVLLSLLRHLEEAGVAEVRDLSAAVGVRPNKVRELLSNLERVRDDWEVIDSLRVEMNAHGRSGQTLSSAASLVGLGADALAGLGLDEFGLFAYGSEEVADRLGIIDAALTLGGLRGAADLKSARRKLAEWGHQLQTMCNEDPSA